MLQNENNDIKQSKVTNYSSANELNLSYHMIVEWKNKWQCKEAKFYFSLSYSVKSFQKTNTEIVTKRYDYMFHLPFCFSRENSLRRPKAGKWQTH